MKETLEDRNGQDGFLEGQVLIASPAMGDDRFSRAVILICTHSDQGAMGLVINKPLDWLSLEELLDQLKINAGEDVPEITIRSGGPVETGRGFVLHTPDYLQGSSLKIGTALALTATADILKAIACGQGPRRYLVALGYAGWSPGQLEGELKTDAWVTAPADELLVYQTPLDDMWAASLAKLGIAVHQFSGAAGNA